jgi:hypothetical protein
MASAKGPPVQAYNVAAGHSRWSTYHAPTLPAVPSCARADHSPGGLRVSDAGGSRRSYRNGRASAVAEGTPTPRGPQSRRWGGRLAGTCHPAHVGTAGLLPVYTLVLPVISAGPILRFHGVRCRQAPMATAFVLGPQGYNVTLVLRVWVSLTSYTHIVQREPVLRGEVPRFVGR